MSALSKSGVRKVIRTALDEVEGSKFARKEAAWRSWIKSDPDSDFPAESGRYHLFVSYACPWAHRTLVVRALKGLEDAISYSVVHPVWQKTRPGIDGDGHAGWWFHHNGTKKGALITNSDGNGSIKSFYDGADTCFIDGVDCVRDIYEKVGDTDGKYTVPILYDKKKETIVSNESSEIVKMLNSEFNAFASNADLDLQPKDLDMDIEAINAVVYPTLNNGVYRCGFARTQQAYDEAIKELSQGFDKVEQILSKTPYLCGDKITLADIRLWVTLVRYDEVYNCYFKTNTRLVRESPPLTAFCRRIWNMPGVKATTNMEHIKAHYYCSHPNLNYYSIIPVGKGFEELMERPQK